MAIPGGNPFAYPDRIPLSPPISIKPDTIDYPYTNHTESQHEDVNNEVLFQDIMDQLTIGSPTRQTPTRGAFSPSSNNLQSQQTGDYFAPSTAPVPNPANAMQANSPAENAPRTQPSAPPSVVSTNYSEQEPPPNFPASILATHPQPASPVLQRANFIPSPVMSNFSRHDETGSLSSDSTLSKHSSAGYEKPAAYSGNERLAQQHPAPPPAANMHEPGAMTTLAAAPSGRRQSYWSIPDSLKSDNSWHRGSWASEDSGRSNIQMALDDTNSTISGYTGTRQGQHQPYYYNNSTQIQPPPSSDPYAFPNVSYAMSPRSTAEQAPYPGQNYTSPSPSPSPERERERSFTQNSQPSSPSLERRVLSRQYTQSQQSQQPQQPQQPQSPQGYSPSTPTLEHQNARPPSQDSQGSQASSQATSNHSQTPLTPIMVSRTMSMNIPPPAPPHEPHADNPTSGSYTSSTSYNNSLTSPTNVGFSPLSRTTTTRSIGSIASFGIDIQFSTSNPLIYHNRRSQPLELGGSTTLWTTLDSRSNSGEELHVKFVNSYLRDGSPNIAKSTPNEGILLYGYGLLHAAIILKSLSLLTVLLQAGANPDSMSLCALDEDKVTPLYLAAKLEWVEGLNILVQYSADVRHALGGGKFKKTAFTIAAELGKLESLRALIIASQQGGWVNVPDGNQITPLHWACWHNHLECVRLLLGEGRANAEVQDREGLTPLHFAAKRGHAEIITCLVQDFRVNPNFTFNKKTGTPLDVAKKVGTVASRRAEEELRRWGGMTYKDLQKSLKGRR